MSDLDLNARISLDLTDYKQSIEEAIEESKKIQDSLNFTINLSFGNGSKSSTGDVGISESRWL